MDPEGERMTALEVPPPDPSAAPPAARASRWRARLGSVEALVAAIVLIVAARAWLVGILDSPRTLAVAAVFLSLILQALPFLVLSVLLTSAIVAFVPGSVLERVLRHDAGAFALTSPAVSPVVLVATAVGSQGSPARVGPMIAGLIAALAAGSCGGAWVQWPQRPAHARALAGPRGGGPRPARQGWSGPVACGLGPPWRSGRGLRCGGWIRCRVPGGGGHRRAASLLCRRAPRPTRCSPRH
jgi:hypothetical protein